MERLWILGSGAAEGRNVINVLLPSSSLLMFLPTPGLESYSDWIDKTIPLSWSGLELELGIGDMVVVEAGSVVDSAVTRPSESFELWSTIECDAVVPSSSSKYDSSENRTSFLVGTAAVGLCWRLIYIRSLRRVSLVNEVEDVGLSDDDDLYVISIRLIL